MLCNHSSFSSDGRGWGGVGGHGCHAYRIQLADLVPFRQKVRAGIEHGPANDMPSDCAGVTYGYAGPGMTHSFKPVDVVGRVDRPVSARFATEAETLFDPKSGGKIIDDINDSFFLSGGRAVSTAGDDPAESFALLLDAPETSAYQVTMGFHQGPGRGQAQLLIDGQPFGQAIDTYSSEPKYNARTVVGMPPS